MQEGDRSAAGGGKQKADAFFSGQRFELEPVGSHKSFIGADDMLPGHETGGDIAVGRFDAAHDLDDRIDRRIRQDPVELAGFEGGVVLSRADKNKADIQTGGGLQHFIYPDADGAETKDRSFHITPQKHLSVRQIKTLVFLTETMYHMGRGKTSFFSTKLIGFRR